MELTLGEHIRINRMRLGMSQADLARKVGISKTAMNDIERGKTTDPKWSTVVAIAGQLGLKLDTLIQHATTP